MDGGGLSDKTGEVATISDSDLPVTMPAKGAKAVLPENSTLSSNHKSEFEKDRTRILPRLGLSKVCFYTYPVVYFFYIV